MCLVLCSVSRYYFWTIYTNPKIGTEEKQDTTWAAAVILHAACTDKLNWNVNQYFYRKCVKWQERKSNRPSDKGGHFLFSVNKDPERPFHYNRGRPRAMAQPGRRIQGLPATINFLTFEIELALNLFTTFHICLKRLWYVCQWLENWTTINLKLIARQGKGLQNYSAFSQVANYLLHNCVNARLYRNRIGQYT